MTVFYIQDDAGKVVAQFDGPERETKTGHEKIVVESIDELPGVDQWDDYYVHS